MSIWNLQHHQPAALFPELPHSLLLRRSEKHWHIDERCFPYVSAEQPEISAAVQYMIDKFNLRKVIFIGTATLVADYLDYGDIIIPDRVSEYDLSIREIEPLIKESNIIELNKVNVSMKYFDGLLGTSDKSLVTKKDYLMAKETDMVASDTEAAAIARVCRLNNIDIVIIKGISDRISEEGDYSAQTEEYEETAPGIIDNITRNYLNEVL